MQIEMIYSWILTNVSLAENQSEGIDVRINAKTCQKRKKSEEEEKEKEIFVLGISRVRQETGNASIYV